MTLCGQLTETQNDQGMMETARVLAALRRVIKSPPQLKMSTTAPRVDPRFPAFNSFTLDDVTMTTSPFPRSVFCETYAHQLLDETGCAPKLVVCLDGSHGVGGSVTTFHKALGGNRTVSVHSQHYKKNLCHGDFHDTNVLIRKNGKCVCTRL